MLMFEMLRGIHEDGARAPHQCCWVVTSSHQHLWAGSVTKLLLTRRIHHALSTGYIERVALLNAC